VRVPIVAGWRGLAAPWRRFAGLWHADLADPQQMRRVRTHVIAATSALTMVATTTSVVSLPAAAAHQRRVMEVMTAWCLVAGLASVILGPRMGDRGYFVVMVSGLVSGTVVSVPDPATVDVTRVALAMVVDLILGAVFLERRRWVVLQTAAAVALTVAVAPWRSPTAPTDVSMAAVSLVVVGGAVRLLRELAISALQQARRGEVTDPLTGLVNRRGLDRLAGPFWEQRATTGRSVVAMVVDVDHFKRINDTQGHAAGDAVLRRLGEVLTASLRSQDVAVRLGGEEFLLLCDVPEGHGTVLAERLRGVVAEELAPVTVSIGVHESVPDPSDALPESVWSAVDLADQALYQAKRDGRNRVVRSAPLAGPG